MSTSAPNTACWSSPGTGWRSATCWPGWPSSRPCRPAGWSPCTATRWLRCGPGEPRTTDCSPGTRSAAGDRAAAGRYAFGAAQRAARLGAHREAADHYRTALRFADGDRQQRAALLVALSYECYLFDEQADALAARTQALEIAELTGDRAALGVHQRWLSRLSWFLGGGRDPVRYADQAVATLEPLGDSHELGMAYSNRSQVAMLGSDIDGAERWGELAIALARRLDDREVETHALNNVGTARLERGDSIESWTLMKRSLDMALADDAHEHVARAYTNLGTMAGMYRRLPDADRWLRAGIAYCADRDLDSWTTYMSAHLARTMAESGAGLDDALTLALGLLARPRLAPVTTIVAATVAGVLPARRGEDGGDVLDRAWQLAVGTGESQRLVQAGCALAEVAWLVGEPPPVDVLDRAWAAALANPVPWELAEIAYWRRAAGLDDTTDTSLPQPFALMRHGDWRAAARAWESLGCPGWQAVALGRDASIEAAREAYEILTRLQLPAVWAAIARDRNAAGLPVPRGPRAARAANPAGLTARELDILQLMAEGLTNAAIAGRLYVSARTVDHHVAAVLRKLDQPTRGRAVAAALRDGLIELPGRPG